MKIHWFGQKEQFTPEIAAGIAELVNTAGGGANDTVFAWGCNQPSPGGLHVEIVFSGASGWTIVIGKQEPGQSPLKLHTLDAAGDFAEMVEIIDKEFSGALADWYTSRRDSTENPQPDAGYKRSSGNTDRDRDIAILKLHCHQLSEHFPNVQILASRQLSANEGTVRVSYGHGDSHARYGLCKWFTLSEEGGFSRTDIMP